ncbi:MAG: hypothetical protein P4M08_03295 [Oligoflexia bacterium]|nr:hypothetical protein [Oligoflexia bacterium]
MCKRATVINSRPLFWTLLFVFGFGVEGCGGSHSPVLTQGSSPSAVARNYTITIPPGAAGRGAAAYGANPLEIVAGSTVTWVNGDAMSHTATANGGNFDTGVIGPGKSVTSPPLTTPGNIPYYCRIHGQASMSGALTVVTAEVRSHD